MMLNDFWNENDLMKQTEQALERANAAEKRANKAEQNLAGIIRPEEYRILSHLRMAHKLTQEMIVRDQEADDKIPVVNELSFTLGVTDLLDQVLGACARRAVDYT